ncbi:hypothetical protein [Streptomyces decoyicus]|uniref:hypothetical protein n=1 Tax=Streptomyces decoyicus TaxID=249567 RepID=UPI003869E013|nr:hypothetical protein OG532_35350 [Streptomyces decoyicus]
MWDFIGQLATAIYEHAAVRRYQAPRLVLLGYGRSMRQLPYDLRGNLSWDTARIVEPGDLRHFFEQVFHEAPPEILGTRLKVPPYQGGAPLQPNGFPHSGTGWLIAPGLLVTNHHVVNARTGTGAGRPVADAEGRTTAFVNVGTQMCRIMRHLRTSSPGVHAEIETAQQAARRG